MDRDAAKYSEVIGLVEKPVRYIGQEWNQIVKPKAPGLQRVAFAFPDTYEIGMSHLGLRILYDLLNRQPDIAAERVFCPAIDMEAQLRRFNLPLATLETRTPLHRLDVVGFSLQFEMEYTNILTMLDLGGIPLHSADRTLEHPLVLAGGPCALAPEPLADFIDVVVIGDGEETFPAVVRRWAELRQEGGRTREEMLIAIAQMGGMYAPSLYRTELDPETGFFIVAGPRDGIDVPFPVRREIVEDLDRFPYPTQTLVPYGEIVHDRVSVEIARGCTEGCRFCQAGIIYRPVRERTPADIIRAASQGLRETGYDEVSLTSLSTADYSCVSSLVKTMMDQFEKDRTAISVSSMRVYGLTRNIAEQLARVRRTGFTVAPEAGTQRMRDLINKGVTDADIDAAARIAWGQGWTQLKMYFMIGLPTETDDDVMGIARTGIRVAQLAREMKRHGSKVTVSTSSLIPKPHSTFQWEPMGGADELRRRQRMILDHIRPHKNVKFKYHDVDEGVIECVLSRGDRRLGAVIEEAWRRGARFDAWNDHFDFGRWMSCIQDAGIDPEVFLRRIPLHAKLPWDHIDSRVTKQFLVQDLHRSQKDKFSPACEKPFIPRDPSKAVKPLEQAVLVCYSCGLECDLDAIKRERIASRDSLQGDDPAIAAAFRGERAPAGPRPEPAPVRFVTTPNRGDGRATNAFEAASGTRHGSPMPAAENGATAAPVTGAAPVENGAAAPGGRDLGPEVHVAATAPVRAVDKPRFFYRVRLAKREDMRWLSHLDLMRALQRAFKRAGIEVSYTQGFHPQPSLSFGPALAVGVESEAELFDFETASPLVAETIVERMNTVMPADLRVLDAWRVDGSGDSLAARLDLAEYRARINDARRELVPEEFAALDLERFHDAGVQQLAIDALLQRDSIVVRRRSKGVEKDVDIRPFVRALEYLPETAEVRLVLRLGSQGQAKPQEVLQELFGVPGTCFRMRRFALLAESDASVTTPAESALA